MDLNMQMMKRCGIPVLFLIVLILPLTSKAQQRNIPRTKVTGPTYITSPVFLQGVGSIQIDERKFKSHISIAGISQFIGYQFSPYVAAGIGAGFEYWTNCNNAFTPIYADLRVNLSDELLAPHWYLNVGFANRWYIDSKPYISDKQGNSTTYLIHGDRSGIMVETGLGVKAKVSQEVSIVISGAFKLQESSVKYYEGDEALTNMKALLVNTSKHNWYMFAGIRAGIIF